MAEKIEQEKKVEPTALTQKPNKPKPKGLGIVIGLVILAAIAGGIIYLVQREKDTPDNDSGIAEIRNAFPDLSNNSSNNNGFFYDATSTPNTTAPPEQTATSSQPLGARSGPTPTAGADLTPPPTVYRSAYGYEFTLPGTWATDPSQNAGNKELFFSRNTGRLIGSVETYSNTTETLESLERILKGSPEVTGLSRTTVGGIPAISYAANGTGHAAIVFGSRIYYLHDQVATQNIKFIN